MTITRRAASYGAAALLTTAAIAAVPASPALAHDSYRPASCPSLTLCGYVDINYQTGQGYELNPTRPAGTCEDAFYINAWSGVFNNSGRRVTVYKNVGCQGSSMDYGNGQGDNRLNLDHPGWDNDIASYRFR